MASPNYWSYKAKAEEVVLVWKDVLDVYEDIRHEHNTWLAEVKVIRNRAVEAGMRVGRNAADASGADLNTEYAFDDFVHTLKFEIAWLTNADDADQQVWTILRSTMKDFHLSEDEVYEKSIDRLLAYGKRKPVESTPAEFGDSENFDPLYNWF